MRDVIYYEAKWSPEARRNIKVEAGKAKFHQFGVGYEEFEGGPGNYSTAIIETKDGHVLCVPADYIRFVQEEK